MKILHPTDFSEGAAAAQAEAIRLAKGLGGQLVLLHVLTDAPVLIEDFTDVNTVERIHASLRERMETLLAEAAEKARAEGIDVEVMIEAGVPSEEIARVSKELGADMVVVGTHGRGGLSRFFLGSVADRVIRTTACPVLTVRVGE